MSVTELTRAFEQLSSREKEEFAEWYEGKLAEREFEPSNEALWVAEADRRLDEIRAGKVQSESGPEVFEKLRRRYGA